MTTRNKPREWLDFVAVGTLILGFVVLVIAAMSAAPTGIAIGAALFGLGIFAGILDLAVRAVIAGLKP